MKIKIITLLLITMSMQQAWADGVNFFKGTFEEALVEAKKTNRLLFVDVYTSWCSPCKKMDKEAFGDDKVAALFNANFINYKFNAEDKNGNKKALTDKYGIKSYPTVLFLKANGEVKRKVSGYGGVNALLLEAKLALGLIDSFEKLQVRYDAGERDDQFMRKYFWAAGNKVQSMREGGNEFGEKIAEQFEKYLLSLPKEKWIAKEYFGATKIFMRGMGYMLENPIVAYMYENYNEFTNLVSESELASFVAVLHINEMGGIARKGDLNYLKKAEEIKNTPILRKYYQIAWGGIEGDEDIYLAIKRRGDFNYYSGKKDWESYLNTLEAHFVAKGGFEKINQMNLFGLTRPPISMGCTNQKVLKRIGEIIYRSYEDGGKNTNPYMGIDYMKCMLMMGDIDSAKEMAEKVKNLVKQYGEHAKVYSDKVDDVIADYEAKQK